MKNHPKGYTLIEVIVATAIFTTMVLLAGMAINQGLQQYRSLMEKGLDFWDYARIIWIEKSFNSTTDYYVQTRSDGWFPYFRGSGDGVSYVSLAPFAGELPVVVWLRKEKDQQGRLSLTYYELPVYTKTFDEIEKDYLYGRYREGQGVRMLEDADSIALSYYGYDSARRRYAWFDYFEGSRMKRLPALVRISYRQGDSSGNMIFNLYVNSLMKTNYNATYQALQ
ncbi:general secretion pathway protein J [Syntrophus gentianae]|uniref:General secretion pathway protein J n=1 Tax=Syntrophus gentianae TaxID=43775 RepID=A0A1H8AUB8_9BACT|nr:prepilin-type N-terminal cleavage/methylation domain-containing protein [Syntrophus gentianae]SEM73564.1 general secretion pathway protein J [Syntrophus gentianae]